MITTEICSNAYKTLNIAESIEKHKNSAKPIRKLKQHPIVHQ